MLLKDRFDMPGLIGVERKQQKKSKNNTKHALYVAGRRCHNNLELDFVLMYIN